MWEASPTPIPPRSSPERTPRAQREAGRDQLLSVIAAPSAISAVNVFNDCGIRLGWSKIVSRSQHQICYGAPQRGPPSPRGRGLNPRSRALHEFCPVRTLLPPTTFPDDSGLAPGFCPAVRDKSYFRVRQRLRQKTTNFVPSTRVFSASAASRDKTPKCHAQNEIPRLTMNCNPLLAIHRHRSPPRSTVVVAAQSRRKRRSPSCLRQLARQMQSPDSTIAELPAGQDRMILT